MAARAPFVARVEELVVLSFETVWLASAPQPAWISCRLSRHRPVSSPASHVAARERRAVHPPAPSRAPCNARRPDSPTALDGKYRCFGHGGGSGSVGGTGAWGRGDSSRRSVGRGGRHCPPSPSMPHAVLSLGGLARASQRAVLHLRVFFDILPSQPSGWVVSVTRLASCFVQ